MVSPDCCQGILSSSVVSSFGQQTRMGEGLGVEMVLEVVCHFDWQRGNLHND